MQTSRSHLGEAEIEDLGVPPLGDENVLRLNVAMDDTLAMGGIQRVCDLDGKGEQSV